MNQIDYCCVCPKFRQHSHFFGLGYAVSCQLMKFEFGIQIIEFDVALCTKEEITVGILFRWRSADRYDE